ncbi:uncharacterized protein BO87DRAFT_402094 [Aspergillus neoniger CBS 115656]|uniref:Uncharacterized protein n=1 Tax=Aspergillus neoniger (strain CBS 115656) TaxID=1448310 RepID=A0A318Y7H4_ASPNB|nr:hypothetical protein BO87DRAFT_402094 [Aspergillus neoniger CBS 115656]PYH28630.1 hypothetical protein BO87DRAFT_402094 [Aspergillus neoniger CBS 115656]
MRICPLLPDFATEHEPVRHYQQDRPAWTAQEGGVLPEWEGCRKRSPQAIQKDCDQGERPLMYGLPRAAVTIVVGRLAIAARNHLISSGHVDPGRRQPSPS